MSALTIGQVANICKVNVETVRYYEKRGLIAEPPRTTAGYRSFPEEVVQILQFIKRGQSVGFTLEEMKELINASDNPSMSAGDVYELTSSKIKEIDDKIQELVQMRKLLKKLAAQCPGTEFSTDECSIIQNLLKGEMLNE